MARRLLVLAGPGAQQPGAVLASYDTSGWWHGTPWDVACLGGSGGGRSRVFVTIHNGDLVGATAAQDLLHARCMRRRGGWRCVQPGGPLAA
jgi:hypothetical protein